MAESEEMSLRQLLLMLVQHPEARMSLFCIVLLAALLGWIPSPMTRQQDQQQSMLALLQNQMDLIRTHDLNVTNARVEQNRQTNYSNMLLRTLCRSIATAQRQAECEPKYQGYEEK